MSSDARDTRTLLESIAWGIAGVFVFWSFGYTIMRGSDLWWHIAGGRWMVENGTLWVREPFGFTAEGRWWINDAWLSDVLLYFWSEAFGIESLVWWKWLLIVVTWLLVFRVLARLGGERITAFIVATFGLAVAAPFLDVRPQLYSFLGFAILLDACIGRRPPVWLPALFLVWANLHAAFLAGLFALPLLLGGAWLADRTSGRRLVLLGAACVLASTVNPHGIEVVLRPLRYALDTTSPFRSLGEWKPPFEPGGIRSWLLPYAIGAFAAGIVGSAIFLRVDSQARKPLRLDVLVAIAVGLLTLAMTLRSRRFVPLFAIASGPPMVWVLGRLVQPWLGRMPRFAAPAVAAAVGLYWLAPFPRAGYAFDYLTARYEFPVETLNFIEYNRLGGRVFNYYNWGGYVQLRVDDQMTLFIDGRADTVYTDETFEQYMTVLHERPGWQDVIRQSGAEWVLWPYGTDRIAQQLVGSGAWTPVYRDHKSVLLRRADLPSLSEPKETPDSVYRRLADGWVALMEGRNADAEREYLRALELSPYQPLACSGLARAEALLGKYEQAEATIERCDAMFPGQGRKEWFQQFLAAVKARAGQQ